MHNSMFFEKSHPSKPWVGGSNPSWITIPNPAPEAISGAFFFFFLNNGFFANCADFVQILLKVIVNHPNLLELLGTKIN